MCLKTQNSIKSVFFPPSYKALGVRVFLRHSLKTRGEKKQQQFYNPEKTARACYQASSTYGLFFFLTEGNNLPIFGKTV